MNDLFASNAPETLRIDGADVSLLRQLDLRQPSPAVIAELMNATPWRQESITLWGKTHLQPRLTAWYGDAGARYSYSGIQLEPVPWTPLLLDIRRIVEQACGTDFNSVLINCYRDHRDSMGMHADDEPELGSKPTIASLSLGDTRTFVIKHRHHNTPPIRIALHDRSLLTMRGNTQKNYNHGVPKQTAACGPRINLTFRRIFS